MPKHTLTALVENRAGVLARVANLFRRRNFNIDSLTVGRTQSDDYSRMTRVMEGERADADRVEKNLYKLINVIQVEHLTNQPAVVRDLALIKVEAANGERREITQLCDIFRARIVDVSSTTMIVEITGEEAKIESFVELLRPFGIVEMVRTGVIAMGRGEHTLKNDAYRPQAVAAAPKTVL
jgi:acetolactate synthase-1/3 small subunit